MKSLIFLRLIAFLFLQILCMGWLHAQVQPESAPAATSIHGTPEIRWIKQYTPENQQQNNRFLHHLKDWVFGKDEVLKITKPVAVLARNPDSLLILDQGMGSIVNVQKNRLHQPHALKRLPDLFPSLVAACQLPGDEILFTDSKLNQVFKLSADQKKLMVFIDSTRIKQPTGIAYSPMTHEIWVSETTQHRVLIFDEAGNLRKSIGQRGTRDGEFNFPTYLWINKLGNAYVVDALNFRIQIFDSEGKFIHHFGEAGDASGYFARPKGIATDHQGNVYVVDGLFHTVQVFDPQGNFLYRFGQQGRERESFWMPMGLFIDSQDYIYVADSYNSRVQIFRFLNQK